ncbi:MAG: hypothetical protein JWM21_4500 [Acidobacteria bacterium]|nr:hypothetical protein [Acidobacteriota bacterium]
MELTGRGDELGQRQALRLKEYAVPALVQRIVRFRHHCKRGLTLRKWKPQEP